MTQTHYGSGARLHDSFDPNTIELMSGLGLLRSSQQMRTFLLN